MVSGLLWADVAGWCFYIQQETPLHPSSLPLGTVCRSPSLLQRPQVVSGCFKTFYSRGEKKIKAMIWNKKCSDVAMEAGQRKHSRTVKGISCVCVFWEF